MCVWGGGGVRSGEGCSGGGGGGGGRGSQGGYEQKIEVFVKIQKKNIFLGGRKGVTGWI